MKQLGLIFLVALLGACGERELFAPSQQGILVVDAVLIVGDESPVIRLGRTGPPDRPYRLEDYGVVDAVVRVIPEIGSPWTYVPDAEFPGIYHPEFRVTVQPDTRYRLEVRVGEELLTAETLTPSRIDPIRYLVLTESGAVVDSLCRFEDCGRSARERPSNRLVYNEGLLEARFELGQAAGAQVLLRSLDPDSDFAIEPDFFDEEDFDEFDRVSASPMFTAQDGAIRMPWFAIFFLGDYRLEIHRVDRNWSDLVRTSPEFGQGGGFGGNAGDAFSRPLYRVEGGIGLFGSTIIDSVGFHILPAVVDSAAQ